MKEEDILSALQDLSEEELTTFKFFLNQEQTLPGYQAISKSALENKTRCDVVKLMVQTYNLEGCMEVTAKILEKISRNDLLKKIREVGDDLQGFKHFDKLHESRKVIVDPKNVKKFAVNVTLDPDTAHPSLILSSDGKRVNHTDDWQDFPDNPKRFDFFANVLGEQSFSSCRFYFEVQVKGKTAWDVGVARENVDRKGELDLSTINGVWTFVLRNGTEYYAGDDATDPIQLRPAPEKVGVFVDYEEGLVSFYDVNAAAMIYCYTRCRFKGKLYPFFSPYLNEGGKNSAPLIICPVNQAGC